MHAKRARISLSLTLVAFAVTAGAPGEATAQPNDAFGYRARLRQAEKLRLDPPTGWYAVLGFHSAIAVRQVGGPEQLDSGGGFSLAGGFHLHPRATIEFGWTESLHNPATVDTWYGSDVDYLVLDGFTIGTRIYLSDLQRTITPYLQIGVGLYTLSSQHFGLDSTGTGVQVGVGADWWLTDYFTIGLRIRRRSIGMGPPDDAYNDTFLTTTIVEAGAGLHF